MKLFKLLPIIVYSNINEAIGKINDRPKPLSLYMFVNDQVIRRKIIKEISFGGVGPNGTGSYHGKYSFDTFTHLKSVLRSYNLADPVGSTAPHKGRLMKFILKLMK